MNISEDHKVRRSLLTSIGPDYEFSTGCWIDGNWGHYGVARLISIVQDLGMEISDLDESALVAYNNWDEEFQDEVTGEYHSSYEWLFSLGDEAEDWLNENIAKPGYLFGWFESELFYMPYSWWDEN